MRGEHHRAHAPRIGVVHVRAGGNQQPCRFEVAGARGEQQRGLAAGRDHPVVFRFAVRRRGHHLAQHLRACVNVRAARQQHLDGVGVLLGDGPHQRGLSASPARVHVRTFVDQLRDDIGVAGA